MKFCYLDESGTGSDLIVMVGIIVDAIRMLKTKKDWRKLVDNLAAVSDGQFVELKGQQLYRGNRHWRHVDGGERKEIIVRIIRWLKTRKHDVNFSAVSRPKLDRLRSQFDLDGFQDQSDPSLAGWWGLVIGGGF